MDTDNRAVKQFKITGEQQSCGLYRLCVRTVSGVLVEIVEGRTPLEAEQRLRAEGYQRIPPQTADLLDDLRLGHLNHPPV